MGPPRIAQTWLPPDIAKGAFEEEPKRFAALVHSACEDVQLAASDTDPNRWHRVVKWLPHINTFSSLQLDCEAEVVLPLVEALWRVVLEAAEDVEVQSRTALCLTTVLKANKRALRRSRRLVLPWRPLLAVMQRTIGLPLPKLEGVAMTAARGNALMKLAAKARRYFPPEALGEVWAALAPAVSAVGARPAEAYEALGYLQLFAPTHNICACPWAPLNAWVRQWMGAWGLAANSAGWDALWLALVGRAAKHDWRGVIAWRPHLPHLYGAITAMFDVPVGAARGGGEAVNRPPPGRAGVLFGDQMGFGPFHGARLAVHLLRSLDPAGLAAQAAAQGGVEGSGGEGRAAASAASAAAAAGHLEHLTALLEQYYHPSNTGKWSRELATLLKHLAKVAVKQLERQHPPPPAAAAVAAGPAAAVAAAAVAEAEAVAGDDSEWEDEYALLLQLQGPGDGPEAAAEVPAEVVAAAAAATDGSSSSATAGGSSSSRPWVAELREPELQRLAACCVKLAARGQFSKDNVLANASVVALSQLAVVAPRRVLPLALERFRAAVATETATHQLVAATATLALCARPLLLAGYAQPPAAPHPTGGEGGGEGGGELAAGEDERETAAQLLSEALMAVIPGLDANDEPKTGAVLQLYVAVMSALPRLRGAGEDDEDDAAAAAEEEAEHGFGRSTRPLPPYTPPPTAAAAASAAISAMDIDASASASGSKPGSAGSGSKPGSGSGSGSGAQPRDLRLSLYVEEWAEEVAERCLTLLGNLDAGPAARGTDMAGGGGGGVLGSIADGVASATSSFITAGRTLFSPMWQLLLHHSRPALRRRLVGRLAAFVLGGGAPGMDTELSIIATHAAGSAPRETLRVLLLPLLRKLEAEVAELPRMPAAGAGGGAAAAAPSATAVAALRYRLTLLAGCLGEMHADHVMLPHIDQALAAAMAGGGGGSAAAAAPSAPSAPTPSAAVAALPPGSLAARAAALGESLLGCNSGVLQSEGGGLCGNLVMLLNRYWLEPHLPWRRGPLGGAGVPLTPGGVEGWVDKFGTGYRTPSWTVPTPEHLAAAEALVELWLAAPAARLAAAAGRGELASGGGVDGGAKLRAKSDLFLVSGVLATTQSMLRDFDFTGGAGGGGGQEAGVSLAVFGSIGRAVGRPGIRDTLADAMAAVCSVLAGQPGGDPELRETALRCATLLISAGSTEWRTAQASGSEQRGVTAWFTDPPAAARLLPPGAAWRRRMPHWAVQSRLFNAVLRRASSAAFRGSWATTARPQVTDLAAFPPAYLALLRAVAALCQHPAPLSAKYGAGVLAQATKRFPALAPVLLPHFLAAMAGVPYNPAAAGAGGAAGAAAGLLPPPAFFASLRDAALTVSNGSGGEGGSNGEKEKAAAGVSSAPADVERDGRVAGACLALSSNQSFWRLLMRHEAWLAALLAALLAGRVHNGSVPQRTLGDLLLLMAGRMKHPPAMSYSLVAAPAAVQPMAVPQFYGGGGGSTAGGISTAGEPSLTPYADLVLRLVDIARPGGGGFGRGTPFRYGIIANVVLLLLLPHRVAAAAPEPGVEAAAAAAAAAAGPEAAAAAAAAGPDPREGAAAVLLRHMLSLLGSEAPQLRQLGMSGVFLPLTAVLEYGEPVPYLQAVLRQTIDQTIEAEAAAAGAAAAAADGSSSSAADGGSSSAAAAAATGSSSGSASSSSSSTGGFGGRLMHALIHDHSDLDNAEQMKDKRGAGMLSLQQRLMNMTFEEMAGGLAGMTMDRLCRWPADNAFSPPAVGDGSFVVKHARLVQLLAAAAPEQMLRTLRPRLEALTTSERLAAASSSSDKCEMAAAAEALAGLVASGAPWAAAAAAAAAGGEAAGGGGGGGWAVAALGRAVRATSLDMAGSWALSYRFAVRGMLDALCPERLHAIISPAALPGGAAPPRPLLAAALAAAPPAAAAAALGDLLRLTIAPPPSTAAAGAGATAGAAAAGSAATAEAGAGSSGSSGFSGLAGQLKRLRCVGEVVRELVGVDPSKAPPAQVLSFLSGVLDELSLLVAATAAAEPPPPPQLQPQPPTAASAADAAAAEAAAAAALAAAVAAATPDSLRLRENIAPPLLDVVAYLRAADGLLARQQQALAAAAARKGNGNGNGNNGNNGNGGGEADIVHVSAAASGQSSPVGMEVADTEDEGAVLVSHRASAAAAADAADAAAAAGPGTPPPLHASLLPLQARAARLALALANRFNAAAVSVQEARGATAATATAPAAPAAGVAPATPPRPAAPAGSSAGGASADDVVVVERPADEVDSLSTSGAGSPATAAAGGTASAAAAAAAAAPMDVDMDAAAAAVAVAAAEPSPAQMGGWLAALGVGAEVLLLAAQRHRAPGLRELVVGMLPGLMRLQDVAGPELQKFVREFRMAFYVARALGLNTHAAGGDAPGGALVAHGGGSGAVGAALAAAETAAEVEVPWSCRAAALSYCQMLWFRHSPLMSAQQLARLQDVVTARLPDAKAEVRGLAAATLSGLLRGTDPAAVQALRAALLARAAELFGASSAASGGSKAAARGTKRGGAAAAAAAGGAAAAQPPLALPAGATPLLSKHGAVAGLSALLLSHPYDVPAWLPPVLMALVRAAGGGERDGGVRSAAGRALGEFRRTHEAEALDELRGAMDPDDWDSFTHATGTASYFV
ncbi:hypothetical protein HXX76_009627 [Chlamydomonas incerta]|uniref:Proteasome activator Blm10 mid region domain-containing protein n=1 Tax=Chlamydomonas incerta TaxID=51695 RepID=A0A835VZW6_CHLIN|nr:hypothetical protein HXX76_009627 [Chlamydomonas incerta]|eukprot:KAG2431096.1 hypothetical protein HXX76_009627 [Chlamydomonas incerta]